MRGRFIFATTIVICLFAMLGRSEAGGLFLSEFGTEDVALAGAGWAARAQDAATLFKNPAGMSRLEGNRVEGGLQLLYFDSSFSPTAATFGGGGGGNPVGVLPAGSGPLAGQVRGEFSNVAMHFFAFTVHWGSQGLRLRPGSESQAKS